MITTAIIVITIITIIVTVNDSTIWGVACTGLSRTYLAHHELESV